MNRIISTITALLLFTGCAFLNEPPSALDSFYHCQKNGCLS